MRIVTMLCAGLMLFAMGCPENDDNEEDTSQPVADIQPGDTGSEVICEPDCEGKVCGDDGCGGTCGDCLADQQCTAGACVACEPMCDGLECGDDGCGGDCGECPAGIQCVQGECACLPQCDGKDCGDDGCGGSCGSCYDKSGAIDEELCTDAGVCCLPNCNNKQCGEDGCGGICGECADELTCQDGFCLDVCKPKCDAKDCGWDGCTGTCGSCAVGEKCVDNKCVECDPDCDGKDCGSDGCGGKCGTCEAGHKCTDDLCVCVPDCDGFECGDDGCEGTCGECDDGNPCTADACAEGTCLYELLPLEELVVEECLCEVDEDCQDLEDGDICNGTLICIAGEEVSTCAVDPDSVLDCDDANDCTDDVCDPVEGCASTNDDENDCADDDPCNGIETCVAGECTAGEVLVCNDENVCTDDTCTEGIGCEYVNNDENACADADACNGVEACVEGECLAGEALICDDELPCTDDTCDAELGCVYTDNNENACADADVCNGIETCLDGECLAGEALICDDELPCTDDTCDAELGCVYTNNNDNVCLDQDLCNGDETCVDGLCVDGDDLICDDELPCTDDTCDAELGCVYTNNNDNVCLDQDLCNGDETCVDGLCVDGDDLVCDDQDECTADSCDAELGCVTDSLLANCEISDWSDWSDCSEECGGGMRSRTRTVTVDPICGGTECPDLTEEEACNTDPCPCDLEQLDNPDFADFSMVGDDCDFMPEMCELLMPGWDVVNTQLQKYGATNVEEPAVSGEANSLHLSGSNSAEFQGTITQTLTPCWEVHYKRLEFEAISGFDTTLLKLTISADDQTLHEQTIPVASNTYEFHAFNISVLNDYAGQEVTLELRNVTDYNPWSYIAKLRLVAADLVINEIDYDQPGEDTTDFVEVHNASDAPVDLAGFVLELVSSVDGDVYGTYFLADAGLSLPAGGYLVLGPADLLLGLPQGVLSLELDGVVQNGPADGARLRRGQAYVDGVAYEGTIDSIPEGTKAPTDSVTKSNGRCPNGADTDDNGTDFVLAEPPTPGAANTCP